MGEAVIALRGLKKAFGDREVLRGVDLDVFPAENVVVLGRSGSGKSVLIKLVIGLMAPDAGTIAVFGQDPHTIDRAQLDTLRRRIGFSFQSSALYDSMTVAENLAFPLEMNTARLSTSERDARIQEALDAVGLGGAHHRMPADLSGGERKRVGLARTLILRPEIMLYDEPTAGLDPVTSAELNELIRTVNRTRQTASIIITHDLVCARVTGQRVAMLHEGVVLKVGTFAEVFDSDDPRIRGFYDYNFTKQVPGE